MAEITNITRRTALKALPFTGSAIAAPVAVVAAPELEQAILILDARFEAAFATEDALRLAAHDADSEAAWKLGRQRALPPKKLLTRLKGCRRSR